ncbi:MAG TPA: hypothetical protein VGB02_05180 [Pyrinomonadaceae bacterium]
MKNLIETFLHRAFPAVLLVLLLGQMAAAQQQEKPPSARGIDPVFESVRPKTAPPNGNKPDKPQQAGATQKSKRPPYQRISKRINSGKIGREDKPQRRRSKNQNQNQQQADLQVNRAQQIGLTIWQLLPTNAPAAEGETFNFTSAGRRRYLTPVRVSLDTLFEPNDLVRLSFEASVRGYLYVIDQEMYADGTTGNASLVFPNQRIRSGANLIAPGKPVELPDLKGNPFYLELRPQTPSGKTISAEILTVIITDRPISGLTTGDQPSRISDAQLNEWRKKWAGQAEIFERNGDRKKQGYTKAEREAANEAGELTAADPLPETIFLVENKAAGGTLITVPLWYGGDN